LRFAFSEQGASESDDSRFQGPFLFTASYNPSKISMFVVDPNTGALQEVLNSPFASLSTNDPVFFPRKAAASFST